MLIYSLLCILFVLMVAGPLVYAYGAENSYDDILLINHDNSKDPRYFANSFRTMMSKALKDYSGESLKLTNEESVLDLDKHPGLEPGVFEKMTLGLERDVRLPENSVFNKEVYARLHAQVAENTSVRAIAAEQTLRLRDNCQIGRWADASEECFVSHGCDLGTSTSSGKRLIVGYQCSFKRLFAPEVLLGVDPAASHEMDEETIKPVVDSTIVRDVETVDDFNTDEGKVLSGTIITRHPLTVFKGFEVRGDIRSHQSVIIDDGAVVHGNIHAEGDVFLGVGSRVLGIVFTQEKITISDGVRIGQPGKIKSVVARGDIIFGKNCRVYGYIGTEGSGLVEPQ